MAAPINICATTKLHDVQLFRSHLEKKGYYDSTRRIQKVDKSYSAVPVTKNFLKNIVKESTLVCTSSSHQKDEFNKSLARNEPVGCSCDYDCENSDCYENKVGKLSLETFVFEGIEFRFDIIQSQLSKKSKMKSPYDVMSQNLKFFLKKNAGLITNISVDEHSNLWWKEFENDLPKSWEKHGDLVLLPDGCFTHKVWSQLGAHVWIEVAKALTCKRLAKKSRISTDGFRTPQVELLLGDDGWVQHIDNGIKYSYDVTGCMFSSGNVTEKLRVANFDCRGETVVDLYAGIGYFTLPYLVHSRAAHVHACEWNPKALEALERNLELNQVQDRCTLHPGDNRKLTLSGIADRVNLGLIPTSEYGWPVACQVLKPDTGGILHIHENVESQFPNNTDKSLKVVFEKNCHKSVENENMELETARVNYNLDESSKGVHSTNDANVSKTFISEPNNTDSSSEVALEENSHESFKSKTVEQESGIVSHEQEVAEVTTRTEEINDEQSVKKCNKILKFSKKTVVRKEWQEWAERTALKIKCLLESTHGGKWNVSLLHIEHVKSYAPYVDHIVLDLGCKPLSFNV